MPEIVVRTARGGELWRTAANQVHCIVAAYPNARYIAAPENLGFAGGNNLGLQAA